MIKTDNSGKLSFLQKFDQVLNDMTVPGNMSVFLLAAPTHKTSVLRSETLIKCTSITHASKQGALFSQLWRMETENTAQLSGRVRPSRRPQGMVSPRRMVATMGGQGEFRTGSPGSMAFYPQRYLLGNSISERSLQDTSSDKLQVQTQ